MTEFLRETQWLLWIIAALLLGLLELLSFDFVFSMLVIGALAASGAAFLGYGFTVQVFTFAIASLVALVTIRPLLRRWIGRHSPEAATNADALVGRAALTLAPVTGRAGQVKLAGETWSARTADPGATIPEGMDVTVVRIDGATAVVAPVGDHRPEHTDRPGAADPPGPTGPTGATGPTGPPPTT